MKIREERLTVMENEIGLFRYFTIKKYSITPYSTFYKLPFLISNVLPFIFLSKDFLTSIKDVFLSFMIIAYVHFGSLHEPLGFIFILSFCTSHLFV